MHPIFDAAWRRRALAGDTAAGETLPSAVLAPLYRFCFYRVGRKRHLCEAAQDKGPVPFFPGRS